MNNIYINRLSKFSSSPRPALIQDCVDRLNKTNTLFDKASGQHPRKWVGAKLGDKVTRALDGKPITSETVISIEHKMFRDCDAKDLKDFAGKLMREDATYSDKWVAELEADYEKSVAKGKPLFVTYVVLQVDKVLV